MLDENLVPLRLSHNPAEYDSLVPVPSPQYTVIRPRRKRRENLTSVVAIRATLTGGGLGESSSVCYLRLLTIYLLPRIAASGGFPALNFPSQKIFRMRILFLCGRVGGKVAFDRSGV